MPLGFPDSEPSASSFFSKAFPSSTFPKTTCLLQEVIMQEH
jgi:hypothetical protein